MMLRFLELPLDDRRLYIEQAAMPATQKSTRRGRQVMRKST
jgi:hypothetical protein